MIADLRTLEDGLDLRCDVCIVGAGAAGLAIALELADAPVDVILLESGGEAFDPASQSLYAAQVSAHRFVGHMDGRFRVFGGTTTRWGGQALRLSEWDFTERPWVKHSGWPIEHAELARYYPRATELLGLDQLDYGEALERALGAKLPAFNRERLEPYFAKWSAQPNFAERYGAAVRRARNIRVVLHANLTTITLGDGGRVASFVARTLEGKALTVRPRFAVLATGGLETPRILLANRAQHSHGIGNGNDLVGRFLQDHPGGRFGSVAPIDEDALQRTFNVYHRRGTRYSVRFALPPAVQRNQRVASASATLMFEPDPASHFAALKRVYQLGRAGRFDVELLHNVARSVRHLRQTLKPIAHFARGRVFSPGANPLLFASCEQEPDPDSRVVLTDEVDALGMPRLDVQWRLSEMTGRTMRVLATTIREEIDRLGFGRVQLDAWLCADNWREHLDDHFHHMGTTRMAQTPADGVVDTHCRIFGVPNLWIASSAVFPTGGFSNPTLTILALAIRLASHLKSSFAANRAGGSPNS